MRTLAAMTPSQKKVAKIGYIPRNIIINEPRHSTHLIAPLAILAAHGPTPKAAQRLRTKAITARCNTPNNLAFICQHDPKAISV
jgi:hypothetical protein